MTKNTAVRDWVAFNARRRPDHLALVDLATQRRFSYAQMYERVERAARFLAATGIERGDRVAVLGRNSSDQLELLFACKRLGAIFVPMNWRLAAPELRYIVDDATPAILFTSLEFAATAGEIIAPAKIATLDGSATETQYEAGLAAANLARDLPAPPLDFDDTWILIYTSGTTGRPKGAIITYGTTFFNVVSHSMFTRLTSDSVTLIFGPLFHTGALSAYSIPCIHTGATVYVMRNFDAGEINHHISDPAMGITHINGAVTMYLLMSQHETFAQTDYSRLICATISGESAPMSLLRRYHEERGLPLQNIYGLTECGPCLTALDRDTAVTKMGSIGTSVMYTEMRLVGPDGKDVAPGEVGEIWARGPNVSPGYWNNPEKTRDAFVDDWLKTGDAARCDADGYYFLIDRWKDMYISGGENVYPAEVENVLYQLDEIAEAAVIGVPHARWGECGRAIIVLKPGAALDENRIVEHCRSQLAKFKVPASIVFTDTLPRSGGGKVVKPALRNLFGGAETGSQS
ncbi:MAG: long-chain fatty acid--CoA ligase [Proteobacteria bacterium]|nr:long-chain fatty acid--CoA ligase [Pseudomonadota bacterium]MDA1059789.1 long-chain fatty acid--CoA ligase [Pseudomonadota bacterium]